MKNNTIEIIKEIPMIFRESKSIFLLGIPAFFMVITFAFVCDLLNYEPKGIKKWNGK